MISSSDKSHNENLFTLKDQNLNKCLLIYGANGSGKSSVLGAIKTMQEMIKWGGWIRKRPLPYKPHVLKSNDPTRFQMVFEIEGIKFSYYYSYNKNEILEEELSFSPNGRSTKIYSRKGIDFEFGDRFKNFESQLRNNNTFSSFIIDDLERFKGLLLLPNILQRNYVLDRITSFFEESFSFVGFDVKEDLENPTIVGSLIFEKSDVLNYVKEIGLDIDGYFDNRKKVLELNEKRLQYIEHNYTDQDLNDLDSKINELEDKLIRRDFCCEEEESGASIRLEMFKTYKNIRHEYASDSATIKETINAYNKATKAVTNSRYGILIKHGDVAIPYEEESLGTKKLFVYLNRIIDALINNRILICDELESSIHPLIVHKIVEVFLKNKKTESQLLCTTHDINLLNLKFLRRDQIFFTELKNPGRYTDLYSLSDIRNVRNTEDIRNGYMCGRYGAIPPEVLFGTEDLEED